MKKIIGYGMVYLIGLMCVLGMIFRTDSLEDNMSKNDSNYKNICVLNK